MCSEACVEFIRKNLREDEVRGKAVIEVGSLDVNGSVRPAVEALRPASYIGIDLREGPGVDIVCNAESLLERFGPEVFDILITTELLEHVRDWRLIISNLKKLLKPNGLLLITTRSKGFPFHGYPFDFWRYEVSDMRVIFSDFVVEMIEPDSLDPGVFVKVRKPSKFAECDLTNYSLYSIIRAKRVNHINELDIYFCLLRIKYKIRGLLSSILPASVKKLLRMLGA